MFLAKLCFFVFIIPIASQGATLDLQKAFDFALSMNESIKIQARSLEIAVEQKSQALGGLLPKISAVGTYTKQDVSTLTASQRNFVAEDTTAARLTASQTLFKGTQEYAAMRGANRNVEAEEFTLKQSRRELYGQVAKEFYNLLFAKKDLENLTTLLDLTERRVLELQKRTRVGRARKGELLQAKAQAALARSQAMEAKSALVQAETSFYQVTGVKGADLVDDVILPKKLQQLEAYINKLEERPDIQAYKKKSEVAEEQVNAAWGAHLPTLDFSGNYYLKRSGGLYEKVHWDYGLVLALPLFEGGVTQSKVREASASYYQSELTLSYGRKTAEKELRDLYSAVTEGVLQLNTLTETVKLAEANYKEQTRDNRYGLVTSIEVLQALDTYFESRRSFEKANAQVKTAYAQLRAATGEIN